MWVKRDEFRKNGGMGKRREKKEKRGKKEEAKGGTKGRASGPKALRRADTSDANASSGSSYTLKTINFARPVVSRQSAAAPAELQGLNAM